MESFPDYLQAQLDRLSWRRADLSRASGIDASLLGRWARGEVGPGVDSARAFAAAIRRPVLEVLVAAGLLTPQEAKQRTAAPPDLGDLTDEQLLAEVGRRLSCGEGQAITREQIEADPGRFVGGTVAKDRQPVTRRKRTVPGGMG